MSTPLPDFSHLDEAGQIRMVDVGEKTVTSRTAVASARVRLSAPAYARLVAPGLGKGEVLNTARVAGIMAAKRCADLILLCHSLPLSFAGVDFTLDEASHSVEIRTTCSTAARTGVEMEAMTAASVAALTIYDMCKAADKGIVIEAVRLLSKSGGKVVTGMPKSTIELLFFGRAAELAGTRQREWPLTTATRADALLDAIAAAHPALAPASRLKLAVNQVHAHRSTLIRPGDEVAVFEPMTGG